LKILIAFYSRDGDNANTVAENLKNGFSELGHSAELFKIIPSLKATAADYAKMKSIGFENAPPGLDEFDLIILGTPVHSFSPHPVVDSFTRTLTGVENKKFAIFCTSVALAGTTVQSLSGILVTMGADVIGSLSVKSLFELNEEKLKPVKKFPALLIEKMS